MRKCACGNHKAHIDDAHILAAYEDIIMSAAISGDQGRMWKGGVVRWVVG